MPSREFTAESLTELFLHEGTDKAKYAYTYAREFSRIDPKVILEIGVLGGASIRALRALFPEALVYGIDIDPNAHADFTGDASDDAFVATVIEAIGQPDLIIDDGSHLWSEQRASLDLLWQHLTVGGLYIVEDLETSYSGLYKGDCEPFTEYLKSLVDTVCRGWSNDIDLWTMRLYPRLVVFEKGAPKATIDSHWHGAVELSLVIGG